MQQRHSDAANYHETKVPKQRKVAVGHLESAQHTLAAGLESMLLAASAT